MSVLSTAKSHWDAALKGWQSNYEKSEEDLKFQSDEPNCQWEDNLLRERKNRPVYQIDQMGQFVRQVSNDIRMNTPSITVIPDDENTDVSTAEIVQSLIRGIEYKSNADAAYDTAVDFAIRCGIGFIRVDHDYEKDEGFEQEFLIKRVVNPLAVFIDPNSVEPDGSDAMYGFALEDLPLADFNKQYPKASPISWGEKQAKTDQLKDKITVAEYFVIEEQVQVKGLTDNGEEVEVEKKGKYKTQRKIKKRVVKRYKLSGADILEETVFPGKYIPLIPVYGEEAWIKGERNLYSLIRKAKQAQRLFNLGVSLDIEMLMKQPQASFMAAAGTISGFEHEYADPTKANVLHYNQTDVHGNPAPRPERVAPPASPLGFMNMARENVDYIKSTLGMYNAAIGQRSNETSGVAIRSRMQESDVGNYHFGDNLVRSITHVGKVIVCGLKTIYDTPRAVKVVDKEDNAKMIGINGYKVKEQEEDYNLTEGSFDVRVITGPSFTTQRQEAAETYSKVVQAMPELMPVIGDLVFKYQDVAGAQAISARLKKTIDPKFLDESEREKGEVDPQVAMLTQQLQAMQQEAQATIAQLQAELQSKAAEIQGKQVDAQIKVKELEIKQTDQQIKVQELQTKAALEAEKLALEKQKVEIEAYNAQKESVPQMPSSIKLDTTGFQFMKTPEQIALEEAELGYKMSEAEQEAMELQAKQAQSEAIIQAVSGIQELLGALVQQTAVQTEAITAQTQVMNKPMEAIYGEDGRLLGAR